MSKKDFNNAIKRRNYLLVCKLTAQTTETLCAVHDILAQYGLGTSLRRKISSAIGYNFQTHTAHVAYEKNCLNPQLPSEQLEDLLNNEVTNFCKALSPVGYYFGKRSEQGLSLGWFQEARERGNPR